MPGEQLWETTWETTLKQGKELVIPTATGDLTFTITGFIYNRSENKLQCRTPKWHNENYTLPTEDNTISDCIKFMVSVFSLIKTKNEHLELKADRELSAIVRPHPNVQFYFYLSALHTLDLTCSNLFYTDYYLGSYLTINLDSEEFIHIEDWTNIKSQEALEEHRHFLNATKRIKSIEPTLTETRREHPSFVWNSPNWDLKLPIKASWSKLVHEGTGLMFRRNARNKVKEYSNPILDTNSITMLNVLAKSIQGLTIPELYQEDHQLNLMFLDKINNMALRTMPVEGRIQTQIVIT